MKLWERADHNVPTATIRTDARKTTKKSKWNSLEEQEKSYQNLDNILLKSMKECIGKVTITTNGKIKVNTEEIQEAKKERTTKKIKHTVKHAQQERKHNKS